MKALFGIVERKTTKKQIKLYVNITIASEALDADCRRRKSQVTSTTTFLAQTSAISQITERQSESERPYHNAHESLNFI